MLPDEMELPSLPDEQRKGKIIVIVGKRGLGKTYWLRHKKLREFNRIILVDPMDQYTEIPVVYNIEELLEFIVDKKIFRVRIRTGNTALLDDLCYIAYCLGKCALVIEESQIFIPAGPIEPSPYYMDIVNRGRHRAVTLILVAQRYGALHIAARALWDEIIAFRQTESTDTRALRNASGYDLSELETLPPGKFHHLTQSEELIEGNEF
jgi:DNA helicase HerA-like ATPase